MNDNDDMNAKKTGETRVVRGGCANNKGYRRKEETEYDKEKGERERKKKRIGRDRFFLVFPFPFPLLFSPLCQSINISFNPHEIKLAS